jgi:hypothetical protein
MFKNEEILSLMKNIHQIQETNAKNMMKPPSQIPNR